MSALEDLLQAAMTAPDERKGAALRVLRGEAVAREGDPPAARTGPLLVGMGAAAKLLGVSRATLWRLLSAGRIPKVELFPGSFRVRREDLENLAAGKLGMSGHVSRRGRWRKEGAKG
ncbi:MAG: helix-turn-helix domain-containing protein [Lentisphaerae bacterium]|nr:helix-turn-helix domain-containing protein [Lentisphaerota bacterium]